MSMLSRPRVCTALSILSCLGAKSVPAARVSSKKYFERFPCKSLNKNFFEAIWRALHMLGMFGDPWGSWACVAKNLAGLGRLGRVSGVLGVPCVSWYTPPIPIGYRGLLRFLRSLWRLVRLLSHLGVCLSPSLILVLRVNPSCQ